MRGDENILVNRELLYDLLKQVDVLNSVNGGSIMANVEIIGEIDKIIIKIFAPTVPVESFSIMLNFSQLTVSIFPKNLFTGRGEIGERFTPVFVPMFLKTFEVPSFVDMDRIIAIHDNNDLVLTLPFKYNSDSLLRMIDIIEK